MSPGKNYFPNLDGIRALACLAVFAGHMFDYFNGRQLTNKVEIFLYEHEITGAGAMGVSLFFVLSGFLITYLLIAEKEKLKSIRLKNFYLKRILRIWPMFFCVVLLGFFVLPAFSGGIDLQGVKQHLPWFAAFSNNFDRIHSGFKGFRNDSLGVLWSVAVEEQFYLFWPLLIMLTGKKTLPYLVSLLIVASCFFRYYHRLSTDVIFYHSFSVGGDLAMGGLLAWLGFYSEKFRLLFRNKAVRITGYLFFLAVLLNHNLLLTTGSWAAPGRLLLSAGFAFLIADQSFFPGSMLRISRFKNLSRLGWVSYGFYCIHMFVIILFQKMNAHFNLQTISTPVFYAEFFGVFAITLLLSVLSYKYFEGYFLKMKNRLQPIEAES